MNWTFAKLSRPRITSGLALFAVICFAYAFGGYSAKRDLLPYSLAHTVKTYFFPHPSVKGHDTVDASNRLVSDDQRVPVACPPQTEKSAVLLILGQSNAANHHGQRFRSAYGSQIVNFIDGRCYIAASPLLGASGVMGEYWTQLGNLLLASGHFNQVVLAPVASTGAEVARFAPGGDLNRLTLDAAARMAQSGYNITHVLWHQGERDYVDGTSGAAYRERLASLVENLRAIGVTAPFFVSIASKCLGLSNGGTRVHHADNSVVRAQRALHDSSLGIMGGIDTDTLMDDLDRVDGCHFSATGEQKAAEAWADLLISGQKSASLP